MRHVRSIAFVGALVTAIFAGAPTSQSASSSAVVSAVVPNSTQLDATGCAAPAALEFGTVSVNTFQVASTCTLGFGGNAPSQLRMWQRDQRAPALEDSTGTFTTVLGSNDWWSIAASSSGKVWVGGQGGPGSPEGHLLRTVDAGATWQLQTPCEDVGIYDIDAIDDSTAFLAAGNSICGTVDGGATWTSLFMAPSKVYMIDMDSATSGWAVAGGSVYKTVDGATWSLVYTDAVFTQLLSVSSDGAGHITASGTHSQATTSDYGAVTSIDGGATWTRRIHVTDAGYDSFGGGAAFQLDATTALATHGRGIWRTTNSGVTWTQVSTISPYGPIVRRSDGVLFAPRASNLILRSVDAGLNWTTLSLGSGVTSSNWAIAPVGVNEMWVSGEADFIGRTLDGTATWQQVGDAWPSFEAIATWDADRWIVAGDNGEARRTIDGGTTLTTQSIGTDTLHAGMGVRGGVGIMVGDSSAIMRTDDHGATWSAIASPAASDWQQIVRDETGRIWIAGSSGQVASSTDAGASWTLHTTVPGSPTITALSAWKGTIWVGASGGAAWKSTTAGTLAWNALVTGVTSDITGAWAIDAQTAVLLTGYDIVALSSRALRTTDGGVTFTIQPIDYYADDLSADPESQDRSHAWISVRNASIVESRDAGLTWLPPRFLSHVDYLTRVEPIDHNRVVAVARNQGIARSEPGPSVPDGIPASGSGFGVCLETAPGTASTNWPQAGAGNCTTLAPLAMWQPIAIRPIDAGALIADAPTGTASANLNFGFRVGANQAAATYAADISIEVVAP